MTKVSRAPVEKKKMDQFYDDFWTAIASLETEEEAESFFYDLLTHTERKMLTKRLQVALMLLENHDYQTIRSCVQVSPVTIAKVNNWLNTGADGLTKVARRLLNSKKGWSPSEKGERKRYLAGDLLLPAVETGVKLVAHKLKKNKRRKSI